MLNGAGLIVVLTRRWARKRPQAHAERMADYSDTAPDAHQPSDPYLDRLHRELKEFDK